MSASTNNFFSISVSTSVDAHDEVLVRNVVDMVNAAYERGEKGMWQGDAVRTNIVEMTELLASSKMLLSREQSPSCLLVGCVYVNKSFGKHLGELGMLCIADSHLGKGLGLSLVKAAEEYCYSHGCTNMRLELLSPRSYVHEVKDWLDKWYTRLGYVKGQPEDFGAAFPRIQPLLACDCVFTPYIKQLKPCDG